MVELVEYILRIFAAIVIVVGLVCAALVLLLSAPGLMALFVAAFVAVTAASSGLALLAINFLYPQAVVVVPGFLGLLWLVIPASLASVVFFDLLLEGLVLRMLQRWGMGMAGIRAVEAVAGGLVTALSLGVIARLMPATELSAGAALAAGLIGAFVRYYVGLYFMDMDLGKDDMDLGEELD